MSCGTLDRKYWKIVSVHYSLDFLVRPGSTRIKIVLPQPFKPHATTTNRNVNKIWCIGEINLDLEVMLFCKNVQAIQTSLMKTAQTINEKQNQSPILSSVQTATEGFVINMTVIRKQRVIPLSSSTICSCPDDFIIGVFQK